MISHPICQQQRQKKRGRLRRRLLKLIKLQNKLINNQFSRKIQVFVNQQMNIAIF